MHHYVYCITNLIDHKVYIGKHSTEDLEDGYMGSGKLVSRAIAKHGLENFRKDFLGFFDTEEKALDYEKELVTEEFVSRKDTYNLTCGGKGSWHHLHNVTSERREQLIAGGSAMFVKIWNDSNFRDVASKRSSKTMKRLHVEGKIKIPDWTGRHHSEKAKQKMRDSHRLNESSGQKNSQFGTMWIRNEELNESRKIKKDEFESWQLKGWIAGRKMK